MSINPKSTSLKEFLNLRKHKLLIAVELLLVVVFVLIEWKLENRFFAIFLFVFFVSALFLQNRSYLNFIIPIILIFMVFNTLLVDCLILIKNVDAPVIQHPKSEINTLFEPNAGLEVLPIPVQNMLSMIKDTKIENYQLSPEFLQDAEIMQRIVEGAWPVKMEETSPYVFINTDEIDQYNNCSILADSEDLTLVDCH
jgi:hypothetical protein